MQTRPCEICGRTDATVIHLMAIGRNRRAVRTCGPRCGELVEDLAASIPIIVDAILSEAGEPSAPLLQSMPYEHSSYEPRPL